ncbi:hypothetical protein O181_031348 [Austropuccinia psidii MF-1]|uniref:PhoD-like phosphatase metallophosphatase domain-containing protein n=1 Tax=Austropuccinia psidii MF-1 TaxID=1389203 RepID=A0A9Q3H4I5_9BASI|nr:hypothetical protein [Austropuccinia psidii MF-1]
MDQSKISVRPSALTFYSFFKSRSSMMHLGPVLVVFIQSIFIRLLSNTWSPLLNLISIQLRFAIWVFLRWIPTSQAPNIILSLFLFYCLAWWNCQKRLKQTNLIDQFNKEIIIQDIPNPNIPVLDINSNLPTLDDSTDLNSVLQIAASNQQSTSQIKLPSSEIDPLLSKPIKKLDQKSTSPSKFTRFLKFLIGFITDSIILNRLNFLINLILILFCLDYTFRTLLFNGEENLSFSRVGAVGETWAKIHVRIPNPDLDEINRNKKIGAKLIYRPMEPVGEWISSLDLITSNLSDWTTTAKIEQLWPNTLYEYRLTTLDSIHQTHQLFPTVGHFKTAPDSSLLSASKSDGGSFTFAYTSCIKPGFPYNPFRHPLHNDGANQLGEFASSQKIDFVLFLGDFIYADAPFYPGHALKHYWRKYRQSFAAEGWKKVMKSTRTMHIYDDHEILNDWAGQGNDTNETFQPANLAYQHYLGAANFDGPGNGENYYWFRHGDAAFFVWDCRRYRSSNQALDDQQKTMLGTKQKKVFLTWLNAVNATVTFKFVISSTPFMTLWSGPDGAIDTWAGFTTERNELMNIMQYVPNLIVLSGDRHEFAAAIIKESVTEFSTSPLNQFWLPIKTLSQENGFGKTGQERLLKYIPKGSHKFSTLNVDCRNPQQPKVDFKLYIDEEIAWQLTYLGKVVKQEPQQLGELLPTWDQLLKLIPPIKWFSNFKAPIFEAPTEFPESGPASFDFKDEGIENSPL